MCHPGATYFNMGPIRVVVALLVQDHGRAGLESCEISTVYTTGLSKEERGLHLANKSKILQYVNGEKDATMTGHGSIQLEVPRLLAEKSHYIVVSCISIKDKAP